MPVNPYTYNAGAQDMPGGALDIYNYTDIAPPYKNLGSTGGSKPSLLGMTFGPGIGGPLFGSDSKPKTPHWQRLANREWAQGNAVLAAYANLYEPTLAINRRQAADYGDLYRRSANEALAHKLLTQTSLRQGDITDFERLGPEYIKQLRLTNPTLASLYDTEQSEYALGDQLSPSQRRNIQEAVRSGQASRGMGLGPSDVYQEAIQTSGYGDQLRQQRMENAMRAQGLYGDIFQATTGRPSMSPAPQGANIMAPKAGTDFDDLYSYGVNREIQSRNIDAAESASNKALAGQIIGGLLGAGGQIGAAGICWVAREVYGADNPRWRIFRHWLLTRGPLPLLRKYLRHGEAFAAWLRAHPEHKPRVLAWMEEKLGRDGFHPVRLIPA